jgi:predicted TIM-barrel fold metal-dependent hydrolase
MTEVIDAHAHVFDRAAISPRGVDALVPADRTATIEGFTERLARIGAHRAVLVPLDHHDEYVAGCIAAEPDRFRAVAVAGEVELGRTDRDPVEALRARLEAMPAVAVRTQWLGDPGDDLEDSPAMPMLRELADRGLVLWSYLPPEQAPLLEPLIRALPTLRIVLNHFGFTPNGMRVDAAGRPWFASGITADAEARVLRLADHEPVHLMVSGHYALSHEAPPYADLAAVTGRLLDAYGTERAMWGSDFPWIDDDPGYTATLDVVDALHPQLTASARAALVGGTVARLLDFPTTQPHDSTDNQER